GMKRILSIAVMTGLLITAVSQQAVAEPTGGWTEKTVAEREFTHKGQPRRYSLLHVRGHPREGSEEMYDIDITVSDTVTRTVPVRTFGFFDQEFEVSALEVPPSTTKIRVRVAGRYDASQPGLCITETAEGCALKIPTDPNWFNSPDSSQASLVITVTAMKDDAELVNETIELPYLGQLTG
ncbi:MAG TPA: hypothetical protein VNP73_00890, partial [Actinomycetota bacterium]|nr:hypothetical protein [Actinomycetota bacterium]